MMLFSIEEEKRKMSNTEQDFHAWRASGIGSSDARVVMHGDAKAWAELKRIKEGGAEKPRALPVPGRDLAGQLLELRGDDGLQSAAAEHRL